MDGPCWLLPLHCHNSYQKTNCPANEFSFFPHFFSLVGLAVECGINQHESSINYVLHVSHSTRTFTSHGLFYGHPPACKPKAPTSGHLLHILSFFQMHSTFPSRLRLPPVLCPFEKQMPSVQDIHQLLLPHRVRLRRGRGPTGAVSAPQHQQCPTARLNQPCQKNHTSI